MSDNVCSSWINGWPTWMGGTGNEWIDCCIAHDAFYARTQEAATFAYLGAHWELAKCVANTSPFMGAIMGVGVSIFGAFYIGIRNQKFTRWPNNTKDRNNS